MPEDGLLEGLGKAGGKKLQMGQERATRGTAVWQDLFLLPEGLFVSLQGQENSSSLFPKRCCLGVAAK